ncbi:MAG: ankyrin repeat domain-containing protein [Myroides sp.]|jgi:ankyrin repeat protein|nr:ankyrin repeat domain-containing protein [Myroides sp.]
MSKEKDLPWIEASQNPWNIKLLDLRPISQTMLSTSKDPLMANNAVSYSGEDGTIFWKETPLNNKTIPANLIYQIDKQLAAGVLFIPQVMEHKWAIYFDGINIIFVRSWLRQVFVVAKTKQVDNQLFVESITGEFTKEEEPEFTISFLNFLLINYVIGEVTPAPLPRDLEIDTRTAGLWAFTSYGNIAQVGTFDETFIPTTNSKLRSHTLLHIAVAISDVQKIEQLIESGININSIANDGLTTLQWALGENTKALEKLIELGADLNTQSAEGATAIMNSIQSDKVDHLMILLKAGGNVNAQDYRGFTALHRAAEMGKTELVKLLLAHNADKSIQAEGYTALSLAKMRENVEIIKLLE